MGLLGNLFGSGKECKTMLSEGAVVVDVRSAGEFASGHLSGSKNIPLDKIGTQINQIKKWDKPVVLCCASGMRSGRASGILKREGIRCCNGGSWQSVARMQQSV